jgi:hypothetical protein
MRSAIRDLHLDHLTVLYPGSRAYALADHVRVVPLASLAAGDPRVVVPTVRKPRSSKRTNPA